MALILVADPSAAFADRVAALAAALPGVTVASASSVADAEKGLIAQDPHVLVVGPGFIGDAALALAQRVPPGARRTQVVFVASEVTTDLLRRALHAGVSDVICESDTPAETVAALQRALGAAEDVRATAATPPGNETRCAKVITVFGTKGGVGKSVLATNLAVTLAKHLGKQTILVDLDLQFGDCAIMLGLKPEHTVLEAVQGFDRLDGEMLSSLLVEHSSGLRVLLAPTQPEDAESVTTARLQKILGLLREMADYVVIDTAAQFDETVLTALDKSDAVCAITQMDIAAIKNTKISLQKLQQLGYTNGFMRVVLNRADSKVWLEPGQVEQAIGKKVWAQVPSDRVVPRSVNKGVPVVIEAPRTDVARSIIGLAKKMLTEQEAGDVA